MFRTSLNLGVNGIRQFIKMVNDPGSGSCISSLINTHKLKCINAYDVTSRKLSSCPPLSNLNKVHFDEFQNLIKDCNVTVIDVRQPEELAEHGALPRAINIPLGEVEDVLKNLSDDQFLKKYGCKKPQKDSPIIFSCRSGIRSEKAQIAALKLEFTNVKNYLGGWTEWTEKTKK
ncbi:rhodanese domain-containing protein CG4456-like [Euwallacea fornicatus]|uniref:rhodanese domain-containing protein CG4456-like n=1 Tax=Euwallacea fornicatus TaxID=995702 RepID=UPI0033904375